MFIARFKSGFYPTDEQRKAIEAKHEDIMVLGDGVTTRSILAPKITQEEWAQVIEAVATELDCFEVPPKNEYEAEIRFHSRMVSNCIAEGRSPSPHFDAIEVIKKKAKEAGIEL